MKKFINKIDNILIESLSGFAKAHSEIVELHLDPIFLSFAVVWRCTGKFNAKISKKNFGKIEKENPDFECEIYNKNDCIQFLEDYFDEDVQNAYNKIIPGAFKADLMRYCILYKKGGIYLDAKMKPINKILLKMI